MIYNGEYGSTGFTMPSADGMDYAAMVDELASWLLQEAPRPARQISELKKSVVALGAGFATPNGGLIKPKGQVGTGFFITKEGCLSTCHHVLHDIERDNRLAVPAGASRVSVRA